MEASLRILLEGLIDYAGLYPPASQDMATAVAAYAAYRKGPQAPMLGRFVLPVSRLEEFARTRAEAVPGMAAAGAGAAGAAADRGAGEPWRLSALAGTDLAADLKAIAHFNASASEAVGPGIIDVVELKAEAPRAIAEARARIPTSLTAYFEIPIQNDPAPLLAAIAASGARAKLRTGGVTPEAIPSARTVARFLAAAAQAHAPFKATAGLHHPFRGPQKLTYAKDGPSAVMHGFINVFLAAAFAAAGMDPQTLTALLEETSPQAFAFQADGVGWRGHRLDAAALRKTRKDFALAFGSCSFEDPKHDLEEARWV
jgi:hypothetical protein